MTLNHSYSPKVMHAFSTDDPYFIIHAHHVPSFVPAYTFVYIQDQHHL